MSSTTAGTALLRQGPARVQDHRIECSRWTGLAVQDHRNTQPEELHRIGFRLYERFRPEVPAGAAGWGKKGILDLKLIENARP